MTRTLIRAAVALALVAGFAGPAAAHAIDAEAKLKDGAVTVEAFYDDNTPAENATVTITDPGGKVIAEGKTDARGVWSFAAPPPGKYNMVVDAGAGHRKTKELVIPAGAARPAALSPHPTPGEPPPAADRPGEELTVSEGPTRSDVTGPMRLVWVATGLLAIGLGTWLLTRVLRAAKGRAEPDDPF
jgi:nickel transport protein